MKIVHFMEGRCSPDTAGGVEKVVYYLGRTQAALGHEVSIVCESRKEVLPVPGVRVINIPLKRNCLYLGSEAARVLSELVPEIIHLHSAYIPTGISVARWARRHRVPYVMTPHGNYSVKLFERGGFKKRFYQKFFELPCARRLHFVHSMGDRESIREFGYEGKMIELPNGFAMESRLEPSRVDQKGKTPFAGTTFLFIGRLDFQQKGLDFLIGGFAKAVKGTAEEMRLLIVGPSWRNGGESAHALAAELGLTSEQVSFPGPVFGQEKADLLHEADFFIHTSRWEGFPMSVIEAMAYRKPCVVTTPADPQGSLRKNGLGFHCEMDADSVAEAILRAMKLDGESRECQGALAEALVVKNYSWGEVARRMVEAYPGTGKI